MKSRINLLRFKWKTFRSFVRVSYYRLIGMKIQGKVSLGVITCEWPNKVRLGEKAKIQDGVDFRLGYPFSDNNYIQIGARTFIGRNCEINCSSRVIIGDDCLIASNTTIVDIAHRIERDQLINQQECIFSDIVIEDDVWIGSHCLILKGLTIGRGSVVGSGSLVNKSIPEYQIWAGSPARYIRDRK